MSKASDIRDELNKQLQKKYKKDAPSLQLLSELPLPERLPLNSLVVDRFMGGGLPQGVMVELFGTTTCGKTSLALLYAAACQKRGGTVVFVDLEQTLDKEYAEALGVNTEDVIILNPSKSFDGSESILRSSREALELADMVIIDSIGAAIPAAHYLEEPGGSHKPAPRATMLGRVLPQLIAPARKNLRWLLLINQVRNEIGAWGNPERAPGGKQHDHLLALQIRVTRKKNKDLTVFEPELGAEVSGGHTITLKVEKSKVSKVRDGSRVSVDFLYPIGNQRAGLDIISETLQLGEESGVITHKGNTYSYRGDKIAVGKQSALDALRDDEELFNLIRGDLLATDIDSDDIEIGDTNE